MSAVTVYEFGVDEARKLTEDIRNHATAVWHLLLRAYEHRAWRALGYQTWAEYVSAEFAMSRGRSYQILDQARVIQQIEAAVSTKVDISEREARDIKDSLPAVIESAQRAIADLPTDAPEVQKREAVKEAVQAARPVVSLKTKTTEETTETYDPQTGEVLEPSSAEVAIASAEASQRLQDSRYVTAFVKSLVPLGSIWAFDAERIGHLADWEVIEALRGSADTFEKFVKRVERAASGLRVLEGGAQ